MMIALVGYDLHNVIHTVVLNDLSLECLGDQVPALQSALVKKWNFVHMLGYRKCVGHDIANFLQQKCVGNRAVGSIFPLVRHVVKDFIFHRHDR